MSTHRAELLELQDKARRAGRVANFTIGVEGWIDSVFYMDPEASPLSRLKAGYLMDPLSFAEKERAALADWQMDASKLSPIVNIEQEKRAKHRATLAAQWK